MQLTEHSEHVSSFVLDATELGPPVLAESMPAQFPDVVDAVTFWRACWDALRLAERYGPGGRPDPAGARVVPAERLVVNPNCGLRHLPPVSPGSSWTRWLRVPRRCGADSRAVPGIARANGASDSKTEAAPSGAADTTAKEGVS